ncbi:hypothetical protein [Flavobacterium sp. '19STA2R22 D10 B1']|uniref:hypothetical protein n=1 Tax=Flavobacterium aerium TaxID=3037261 RepID=UPI00278C8DAF|nr:hypothetical protein [Flavobacterium sp. '19STA2R22 D10 B1']
MKKKLLLFSSVFFCLYANGQEKEIKTQIRKEITDRFPATRIFDVQYQQYLPTDFDSQLFGNDFQKGEIQNHSKLKLIANIPFYKKPKWTLTSSFNYRYETFDLKNVENVSMPSAMPYNEKLDFHYLSAAVSFTGFTSLFKKTFIYNASIIADGSNKDVERFKVFFGGTFVLKRTERTTITAGIIAFIDPASPIPFSPTFTLEHKFKNSPWVFDFILPQRLLFKRDIFGKGRISLGSELGSDGFYTYVNRPGFARVYDYRQIEIKSGLTYEHSLGDGLIATFKGGFANVFNSRVTERGKSTNDYIFNTTQDGTGYFSVGISYNPVFTKKK